MNNIIFRLAVLSHLQSRTVVLHMQLQILIIIMMHCFLLNIFYLDSRTVVLPKQLQV